MSEYILKFNQQKKNLYNTVIAKLLQEKKKGNLKMVKIRGSQTENVLLLLLLLLYSV